MKATTKGFSSRPVRLRVLQVQCVSVIAVLVTSAVTESHGG